MTCTGDDRHSLYWTRRTRFTLAGLGIALLAVQGIVVAVGGAVQPWLVVPGVMLPCLARIDEWVEGDQLRAVRVFFRRRVAMTAVRRVTVSTGRGQVNLRVWGPGRFPLIVPVNALGFRMGGDAADHLLRHLGHGGIDWGDGARETLERLRKS